MNQPFDRDGVPYIHNVGTQQIAQVGSYPFRVYCSTNQSIPAAGVVQHDTIVYDVGGWFNTGTYKFTPKVAGYWVFGGANRFTNPGDGVECQFYINHNDGVSTTIIARSMGHAASASDDPSRFTTDIVYMDGVDDNVYVSAQSATAITLDGESQYTYFWGHYIGTGVPNVTGAKNSELWTSDNANIALSMDANGYPEMQYLPMFSAYNSVSDANVTGDGTYYTVICDTEVFDVGGNYNSSTGIFTAPVTGRYLINGTILASNVGSAHTRGFVELVSSNRIYRGNSCDPYSVAYVGYINLETTALVDMNAGHTVYMRVYVWGSTKTIQVEGAAPAYTRLQGSLITRS